MKIPFFKDIGKACDIFKSDNYNLNRTVQITASTDVGKFKTKSVLDGKALKTKLTINKSVPSVGDFEVVTCGKQISVEVKNRELLKGTDLIAMRSMTGDLEARAENKSDTASAKCSMKMAGGNIAAKASGVVGFDGVSVGVQAEFAPGESMSNVVRDYNAAVDWQVDENTTYSLKTSNCCDVLEATFHKQMCNNTQIASRMNYNFLLKTKEVAVGTKVQYGGGDLYATYDSKCLASFLYKRKLSEAIGFQGAARYNMATGGEWMTSWKFEVST